MWQGSYIEIPPCDPAVLFLVSAFEILPLYVRMCLLVVVLFTIGGGGRGEKQSTKSSGR